MSNFIFHSTFIKDLYVIESEKYKDERGYFKEIYNKIEFNKEWICLEFVQDNESYSQKGVLRGLHYQYPHQQDKLIRASSGRIFDVAVDLRNSSETYGQYFGIILTEDNDLQLFIPKGFAHGFLTLSETAKVTYKCTEVYYPDEQKGIKWDDAIIDIKWPLYEVDDIIINDRDNNFESLKYKKVLLKNEVSG